MNRPPHHQKILDLVLTIVNAKNKTIKSDAYSQIKFICETHEGTKLDHPFQWETLGDFTYNNHQQSLAIYFKALGLAKEASLDDYIASISLAIAEQYQALGEFYKSFEYANLANQSAAQLPDFDLRREIRELLLEVSKSI